MKKLVAISFLALSFSYAINATIPGYPDKYEGSVTRTQSQEQAPVYFASQGGSSVTSGTSTPTKSLVQDDAKVIDLKRRLEEEQENNARLESELEQSKSKRSFIAFGSAAVSSLALLLVSKLK